MPVTITVDPECLIQREMDRLAAEQTFWLYESARLTTAAQAAARKADEYGAQLAAYQDWRARNK